ncbi:hypothetical protein YC2023_102498 [Brassica napus]
MLFTDNMKVLLPSLKNLNVDMVGFGDDGQRFYNLLSGCPLIEELEMKDIACPTTDDKPHGVSALSRDLLSFETTSQVPEGLGSYVVSSKKAQANWYGKILEAWKQAKPRPQTDEEAARLVITTLKGHKKADVETLFACYKKVSPIMFLDEIVSKLLTSQPTELAFLLPHVDIYREISFVPPSDSKTSREVHANLKILE